MECSNQGSSTFQIDWSGIIRRSHTGCKEPSSTIAVIRPIALFTDRTPQQRAQETKTHAATVRKRTRRFSGRACSSCSPTISRWRKRARGEKEKDGRASSEPASFPTGVKDVLTLLVKSKTHVTAVLHTVLEDQRNHIHLSDDPHSHSLGDRPPRLNRQSQ